MLNPRDCSLISYAAEINEIEMGVAYMICFDEGAKTWFFNSRQSLSGISWLMFRLWLSLSYANHSGRGFRGGSTPEAQVRAKHAN